MNSIRLFICIFCLFSLCLADYYKILQISRTATTTQIKTAYKKLSRKYHPDISEDPNASEMLVKINRAYEVLKDPTTRKIYDQHGEEGLKRNEGGGGGHPFEQFFAG